MWVQFNINPLGKRIGDCVIRAISKATNDEWDRIFMDLSVEGLCMADMPNANSVWGSYLKRKNWQREIIPNECPECYSVKDFCRDYPKGTYILAIDGHVVAVIDGDYYDTWDSGNEVPIYFWKKGDDK